MIYRLRLLLAQLIAPKMPAAQPWAFALARPEELSTFTCPECNATVDRTEQSYICPHARPEPMYQIGDRLTDRAGVQHGPVMDWRRHKGGIMYQFRSDLLTDRSDRGQYWLWERAFTGPVESMESYEASAALNRERGSE